MQMPKVVVNISSTLFGFADTCLLHDFADIANEITNAKFCVNQFRGIGVLTPSAFLFSTVISQ